MRLRKFGMAGSATLRSLRNGSCARGAGLVPSPLGEGPTGALAQRLAQVWRGGGKKFTVPRPPTGGQHKKPRRDIHEIFFLGNARMGSTWRRKFEAFGWVCTVKIRPVYRRPPKPPKGTPRGRPRHVPTAETRATVARLASQGMSKVRIAREIGISDGTLARHYQVELASEK